MADIFYLCDRTKCKECSNLCNHTTDIRFAKNFELSKSGTYIEQEQCLLDTTKDFIELHIGKKPILFNKANITYVGYYGASGAVLQTTSGAYYPDETYEDIKKILGG